jgi:drug/metabolite transporter (DMT)-like permease
MSIEERDAFISDCDGVPVVKPVQRGFCWKRQSAPLRRATKLWWRGKTDNLRGSLVMIGAFFFYVSTSALVKTVGQHTPLAQVLLFRQCVATILLMPLFLRGFPSAFKTSRLGLQLLRSLYMLGATFAGFTAVIHIPLADATALSFSQVLFTTLAAWLILGESVDIRRWIATLVGFVGVLIILRPTGEGSNEYALMAIAGALCGSGITISVRLLASSEKTLTILLYQAVAVLPFLAALSAWNWAPISQSDLILLISLGTLSTASAWLITTAYRIGEASALAPLEFFRLLIAALLGFAIFNETPQTTTLIGAAIVFCATLYTIRRNASPVPIYPPESNSE